MNEEIKLTVNLIYKQIEGTNIARVIGFDNELKTDNFKDLIDWINELRVLGKHNRKVQIFFEIQESILVPELVKAQKEYCDQYKIGIYTKHTDLEHVKRTRFVSGSNIKLALAM